MGQRNIMELSDKEKKLLEFIKENQDKMVSVKFIEDNLGKEYLGAIGKLIRTEKIEKIKKSLKEYVKIVKCYQLKVEVNNE